MTAVRNLVGQHFGRLTVAERAGTDRNGHALWLCRCLCGERRVVSSTNLLSGQTRACGCLRRGRRTHGLSYTRTYKSYHDAKQRCTNPNNQAFANYGGRGIEFRLSSITQLVAHLGECPPGKTLDRYPNRNGHYEIGNLRWATRLEQARNRRPPKKRRSALADILAYKARVTRAAMRPPP
jgi:hypothetical protein